MSNTFRNTELLQKLERHPLKQTLARALDTAETFQGDVEFLSLNKDLSPQGRQKAMQAKLRAAIRDLRDARAPINEMQKKLDAKRAAVAMPAFDPNDLVGFLRRQELRATLRSMDAGQRAVLLAGNPAFADAMLEQPPALSGLLPNETKLVDDTKKARLAGLFAPQLAEIEELKGTIKDANMVIDLAQVDLKLHSGMDDRTFIEFVKPIEMKQGAPWLVRATEEGKEVIRAIDVETHLAPTATPDQIRDGKFYKDFAEYQADRGAP